MSLADSRSKRPNPPLPNTICPGNAVSATWETGCLLDVFDLRSGRLDIGVLAAAVIDPETPVDETARETAKPAIQNNATAHKTVIFERNRLFDSLAITVTPY